MLTTGSHINGFTRYQGQPILPSQPAAPVKTQPAEEAAARDEVTLSRQAQELQQTYGEKESALEQKHASESQQLEREYLREKSRLEKEFRQKQQALEIDLYV